MDLGPWLISRDITGLDGAYAGRTVAGRSLEAVRLLIFGRSHRPPGTRRAPGRGGAARCVEHLRPTEATVVACGARPGRGRTGPASGCPAGLGPGGGGPVRHAAGGRRRVGELVIGGAGLAAWTPRTPVRRHRAAAVRWAGSARLPAALPGTPGERRPVRFPEAVQDDRSEGRRSGASELGETTRRWRTSWRPGLTARRRAILAPEAAHRFWWGYIASCTEQPQAG